MDLVVVPGLVPTNGILALGDSQYACALGRLGVTEEKEEGDGATPVGTFPLRRVLYRPDRLAPPRTRLTISALTPEDGWCDDPSHGDYNCQIRLPHPGRRERLWRDDRIYDVVVVIGYNDDPVVKGRGSAIFLHVAQPHMGPTEGCIAMGLGDLLDVLEKIDSSAQIRVEPAPAE